MKNAWLCGFLYGFVKIVCGTLVGQNIQTFEKESYTTLWEVEVWLGGGTPSLRIHSSSNFST